MQSIPLLEPKAATFLRRPGSRVSQNISPSCYNLIRELHYTSEWFDMRCSSQYTKDINPSGTVDSGLLYLSYKIVYILLEGGRSLEVT